MNEGIDLIKRQQPEIIDGFPTGNIFIGVTKEELTELEKELKDYQEIKEIAKRFNWDDFTSEIFNVETDKKYRDLFNGAIVYIQENYRKARALELVKKCFYVAKSSGAILLTDYGFEHKEELKKVLYEEGALWTTYKASLI